VMTRDIVPQATVLLGQFCSHATIDTITKLP
jgi:hypothetical protein